MKIIKHPNGGKQGEFALAIIVLNLKLNFNEYVQAIDLPEIDECFSGSGMFYGWGKFESGASGYPGELQQLEMPILKRNICTKNNRPNVFLTNLCLGPMDEGKAPGAGDHGGPVVYTRGNGKKVLIGIMSHYNGYPNEGYGPSYHTNIALFRDFIDNSIKQLKI